MELDAFSFEQFALDDGPEGFVMDAKGIAGRAKVELDTGNFTMENGVLIDARSEDISIETQSVSWEDKEHVLKAPGDVSITRSDGTELSGYGFSADIRRRTWEFEKDVKGTVVEKDNDTEDTGAE
jgi:lipopolysaccharide assembly outer membrane protein LptD (OstA)